MLRSLPLLSPAVNLLVGVMMMAVIKPGRADSGDNVVIFQHGDSRPEGRSGWAGRQCFVGQDLNATFLPCSPEHSLPPRVLPSSTSIIETSVMPESLDLTPEVGNGHLATLVRSHTVFMNGLYNGFNTSSHRARIPSTAAVLVSVSNPDHNVTALFRLDVDRGVFSEVHNGSGFSVEVRRYAHRELTRLLVTEVVVKRTTFTLPITLSFTNNTGNDSEDIDFVQEKPGLWSGRTKEAEYPQVNGTTPMTVVFSLVPPDLTFPASTEGAAAFLTSVSPFRADALKQFDEGKARLLNGTLFSSHASAWSALWQRGRIELKGNDSLALATNAAMYYLLTALPLKADADWPFVGLSPGGLAHGGDGEDYWGHVFWDQDTWMFPPLALLHADLGRLIVDTRIRTLDSAHAHARQTGFEGARYPWESAFTGFPVSPSWEVETYEVHVTGDAAWMMRQYLQLTNDTDFLTKGKGHTALASIADFWVSRSIFNQTSKEYEILGVMGPDEWHSPVNNSVFTNVMAVQSARTALYAAWLAGKKPNPLWEKLASNMFVPFDAHHNYHPEYDSYTRVTDVKQADVVLLGYPLRWPMSDDVRRNDLNYYAKMTPRGPAMTWSVFAINWLRLREKDQADQAFLKSVRNVQEPFKVWSENSDGTGAYNFQTGMGGHLQSLLYGYLGVDLNDNSLDLDPQLPPSVKVMGVRGVDYLGWSVDVAFDASHMNITATMGAPQSSALSLVVKKTGRVVGLRVGTTVTLDRQAASIVSHVSSVVNGASVMGSSLLLVFVAVLCAFAYLP